MNGQEPTNEFSDFLSPTTADEGPISTRNIPRKRKRATRKHEGRKKRRQKRAS